MSKIFFPITLKQNINKKTFNNLSKIKFGNNIPYHKNIYFQNIGTIIALVCCHHPTGARGTDHPPFSNFLFTNLFSIKFLYFFIISFLFPYSCQYSYNIMSTSNCMCRPQGLVTIQVNILSMYKHICLYIDSIFTWIVTRPCVSTLYRY